MLILIRVVNGTTDCGALNLLLIFQGLLYYKRPTKTLMKKLLSPDMKHNK